MSSDLFGGSGERFLFNHIAVDAADKRYPHPGFYTVTRAATESTLDNTVDIVIIALSGAMGVDRSCIAKKPVYGPGLPMWHFAPAVPIAARMHILPAVVASKFEINPINDASYEPAKTARAFWAWRMTSKYRGTQGIRVSLFAVEALPPNDKVRLNDSTEVLFSDLRVDMRGPFISTDEIIGFVAFLSTLATVLGFAIDHIRRRAPFDSTLFRPK